MPFWSFSFDWCVSVSSFLVWSRDFPKKQNLLGDFTVRLHPTMAALGWSPETEVTIWVRVAWLTFLGYLYGAVTDFTCCCSSLTSFSWSRDRNSGVRTINAFTTFRMGVEVQMHAGSQSLARQCLLNGQIHCSLSWCLRLRVTWKRKGPGLNPCPPHFHCMP